MNPRIGETGKSFKGALLYYLHDKRQEGEEVRLTSERVAWTETRNLLTDDPELAGKIMAATAMDAERLKRDAGVRAGRKSSQHVFHYSLGWHPEERDRLTREEMMKAVEGSLKAIGAEDRQAVIVCHTDTDHPHVHVIVNRVCENTGIMFKDSYAKTKLSRWALEYRAARDELHYNPERVRNWEIRLGVQAKTKADIVRENPEEVLNIITQREAVFDRRDISRTLHQYIDDGQDFHIALTKVMASSELVVLQPEQDGEPARYSTKEMVKLERAMASSAERMIDQDGFGVERRHLEAAIERADQAIIAQGGTGLSDEQKVGFRHVTGDEQIACLIGVAGTGKSTMLSAARDSWERQGRRVYGAALAGKAADGLQESSGIQSRTLASFQHSWRSGRSLLQRGDVLVIDEAGMVGSRQLAEFVQEAEARDAKIVLVGDHEQLQAIGAGAAFRAIAERAGAAELQEVRRQRLDWQRQASQDFSRHRTTEALRAYDDNGAITFADTADDALDGLVRDYIADRGRNPEQSRIALAHRRADVAVLNEAIRAARKMRGELAGELAFQTRDGKREFAAGDRIVFLENNRDLEVKNGTLGTIQSVHNGRIVAVIDGEHRAVNIAIEDYSAIDHGYATTLHKSQGATVDRAFVFASKSMDRHLSYVAMTRHRSEATLYAGRDDFGDFAALASRLGRNRAKETTLDYAERRGFDARLVEDVKVASWKPRAMADDDRMRYWRSSGHLPYAMAKHVRAGKAVQDQRVGRVVDEQKHKAAAIATRSVELKQRHNGEWEALQTRFKDRRQEIRLDTEKAIQDVESSIKATYRGQVQRFGREMTDEQQIFKQEEQEVLGQIKDTLRSVVESPELESDYGRYAAGDMFNFKANEEGRQKALDDLQLLQARTIDRERRAEIAGAIKALREERAALLASVCSAYLAERAGLLERQKAEKKQISLAWQRYGKDRNRAFYASRDAALSRQEAALEKEAQAPETKHAKEDAFRDAARRNRKPRDTGRKRSRTRTRDRDDDR